MTKPTLSKMEVVQVNSASDFDKLQLVPPDGDA